MSCFVDSTYRNLPVSLTALVLPAFVIKAAPVFMLHA